MSKPDKDEEALVELTRNALADVLGREPSRQEVWKVHAGFKRMAFMLLDHIKKHENENPDQETYPEDMEPDDSEAADEERASGTEGESAD